MFDIFQKEIRKKYMPSGNELAKKAQKYYNLKRKNIEYNFNKCLKQLLDKEYDLYLNYELKCSIKIIKQALRKNLLVNCKDFLQTFKKNYLDLDKFFLSISQSRKARAGGSFEKHVNYLFETLNYPFDKQTYLNGKVDYVIPSEKAFKKSRTSCVVISLKRTLRERWRQVIGELNSTKAGRIYLLTADKYISQVKVNEIENHNIILVVWKELKDGKFLNSGTVIDYNTFSKKHLPSSRRMWEDLVNKN